MIQIHLKKLTPAPLISIICGISEPREYLWQRCAAEMEIALAGLPVEFRAGYIKDEPWNESKAKNAAANTTRAPILLFTNCDIVIPREVIESLLSIDLDLNWMAIAMRNDETAEGGWVENEHAIGDCQAVPRAVWAAAEGFDERQTGWGHIDYTFMQRCERAGAKAVVLQGTRVLHRWHPRLTDDEYRAQNERNRLVAGGAA